MSYKAWTPEMDTRMNQEVGAAKQRIQAVFQDWMTNLTNIALGLGGKGPQTETEAKTKINNDLQLINNRRGQLSEMIDSAANAGRDAKNKIEILETRLKVTKDEVKKETTINDLRKEQAASLANKYEANFHSSWLGLWRPLSEQSFYGLMISSIFFALLAVVGIGVALRLYFGARRGGGGVTSAIPSFSSVGGSGTTGGAGNFAAFVGGAWKKLHNK